MLEQKIIHKSAETYLRSMLCYFVMIPFLRPRGFDEYSPLYKSFFTVWLYGSLVIALLLILVDIAKGKVRYKKSLIYMLCYHILMIAITFVIQNGLGEGLQQMFAAPGLCLVCAYFLRHDTRIFLNCLCNLLVIVLGLNVVVFNPLFFGQYFLPDDRALLMFVGHVQVGAQLGLLGIFVAYLFWNLQGRWSLRSIALLAFSIGTMLMSLTSASFLTLFILVSGLVYTKISKQKKLLTMKPTTLFLIYLGMNAVLYGMLLHNNWNDPFSAFTVTLHGRNVIWKEGMRLVSEHKLFGYGVHGVLIRTPWSPGGINYAHNQLIQVLLDGGIVLLISFLMMLWSFIQPLKYVEKDVGAFARICLLAVFLVMTVESTFWYYYILLFLSLIAYLPEILNIECPAGKMKEVRILIGGNYD